ncbi:MAG: phenylalanine--tRNA ligase subunit beta [Ignavibacteriales bacterium]|nr:phenylalanine--tRNA ligase subunit beta [Ignavibacteriales bacterium]
MIVSLNWLKEYVDLNGISVKDIVDKLTTSGSEVEEVIDRSSEFENITIAKVEDVKKHPNADKLSVCKVNDGTKIYDVVCGAPNVKAGQTVAFAKVGAVIPNGKFEIKEAKIRGEKSSGMICAEDELGLSDDHSGIMILDENLKIGQPLAKALNMDDVILEVAITPNRSDELSHIGLARDLSAIFNRSLTIPKIKTSYMLVDKNKFAEIKIENLSACPRYCGIVVKNVKVDESPKWLKDRLTGIGLRPINNIVDITNFVLHEVGQPLHAFDLDKISGSEIVVKNFSGEGKFTTLDSKERNMRSSDLMICDAEKPVAIAGVMGGENSEVTSTTKNILIESAYFNPSSIRKTAKRLGLSSDASYRFERGIDPNGTLAAGLRTAELIKEIAGGEIINEIIDIYPNKIEPKLLSVRFSRIERILGFKISNENVKSIFMGLKFDITKESDDLLEVKVPTFRNDIEREIDLVEEIIRIYGLDEIPPVQKISLSLDKKVDETDFENSIRNKFTALEFNEVICNSLLSEEKIIDGKNPIKVLNPQSTEMSTLRTSLLPGILMNISRNLKVKENDLMFFEIGQVFSKKNYEIKSFEDFEENQNLTFAVCGERINSTWYQKSQNFDIYDLIGINDNIIEQLNINAKIEKKYNLESNVCEFGFEQRIGSNVIGTGGKLKKEILEKFEISKDVYFAEYNLSQLRKLDKLVRKSQPLLKYPKVFRDFSFILDKKITYSEVLNTIKDSSSKLLKNVNLFDIFESETLGSDKISLAFQLEYFDETKTLREDEIDVEFWKTIEAVKTKFNAELRG